MRIKVTRCDDGCGIYYEYYCAEDNRTVGMCYDDVFQAGMTFSFFCGTCKRSRMLALTDLKYKTHTCSFTDDVGYIVL